MADVVLIEEPSTIRKTIVWIAKGDDETWGEVADEVYRTPFKPNVACVVVTESPAGQFWADFTQVRDHYYGDRSKPAQQMCRGTHLFQGAHYIEYAPDWVYPIRDRAVAAVKEAQSWLSAR